MMAKWETATLDQACSVIYRYPSFYGMEKVTRGVPVIRGEHLLPTGRISEEWSDYWFVPKEYSAQFPRTELQLFDVVMSVRGTVGTFAQVRDAHVGAQISPNTIRLSANPDVVLPRYLYFALKSPLAISFLQGCVSSSAVPALRASDIKRTVIPLPSKPEQAAIAGLLGSIDDIIELNRRTNRLLEEVGRAIFERRLRRLPETELDAGWTEGQLGDLVSLVTERVDATPEKDGERYIALDDMPSKSVNLDAYRLGSDVNSSIIRFQKGDILFGSMRPYFHKVGLAPFEGITRTTTFVLRPRDEAFRAFALFVFSSNEVVEYSTSASVGTTIPYIKWDSLQRYPVAIPPKEQLTAFAHEVEPMLAFMHSANEESRTLEALRDFLLPRLLSGEVDVEALAK